MAEVHWNHHYHRLTRVRPTDTKKNGVVLRSEQNTTERGFPKSCLRRQQKTGKDIFVASCKSNNYFMRFHVSVITEYFACTIRIFSIVGRCTRKSVLFSRLWTGEINMGLILNLNWTVQIHLEKLRKNTAFDYCSDVSGRLKVARAITRSKYRSIHPAFPLLDWMQTLNKFGNDFSSVAAEDCPKLLPSITASLVLR